MKNNEKISVIVCMYNTEKYIRKCIESILNQTYKNIELIIVDDNSSDNSLQIVEEYKEHKNLKIIHNEKNKGASYSRNLALEKSTGKYIGFIDSDDYIDLDFYEKLMTALKKENADLVLADMKLYYEETNAQQLSEACEYELTKINILKNGLVASPCNKLFKKEIITKHKFAEGKMNEDIAVVIPAIINSKKIAYVPGTFYYYVQRNNSTQNNAFSEKRFDIFYAVDLTLKRIKGCENYEKIKEIIVFNQIILLFIYVFPKIKNRKERYKYLKKYDEYTKQYEIRKNQYYWKFLSGANKKSFMYYKLLFHFECTGHYHLANFMISFMNFFKKNLKKEIVKNVSDEDVIKEAKKNANRSDSGVKISVVIPNYNYEKFLNQRLYSIFNQKIKLYEIILLDDVSSDNSKEKIDKYVSVLSPYLNIKAVYNHKNSGSAFKQWKKGFEIAKGEYVWIAEADDYCSPKLLSSLVKLMKKDKDIQLAYSDTAYIDGVGKKILSTIKPEIDILKTGHWNKDFINNGIDEIKNYAYLNCTIANVSSVLFKNADYEKEFNISEKYRQAGDWLFYINVMRKGKIAFVDKPLNYYRVHGNNVTSLTKKQSHLDEIKRVHKYIEAEFKLSKEQKKEIEARYKFLTKVWNLEKNESNN